MQEFSCNDICKTDPESGLCIGRGRTREETTNWLYFNEAQKEKVLKALEIRNKISITYYSMINIIL